MCAGDRTSITLDMSEVNGKQGCWAYSSGGSLEWEMHANMQIDFDAEWQDCTTVWFAPLWLTPQTWIAPQGLSGEIDLIESCRAHHGDTVGTSIRCDQHPDSQCLEPQWGQAQSSDGPVHFTANIDEGGTWTMKKCNFDRTNCQLVSRYPKYLETTKGSQQHMKYNFMSDLYNGGAGDGGWGACGTLNLNSQCKYKIANIQVSGSSPTPPTPTPPTPSAACSANPGCAHLSGNCCPANGGVMLACCGHSPTPPSPPMPPTPPTPSSAACNANAGCAALGLSGDCCPANGGMMLACCGGHTQIQIQV